MIRRVRLAAVLLTFSSAPLIAQAQQEAPAAAADGAAAEAPKEELVLPVEPKTADELVRGVILTLKLARPELARRYVEALVKMEPDDETLLKLRDQYGTALFLQLSRNKDLQPASTDLLNMLTKAAGKGVGDPARVQILIDQLSGSVRERELAIAELQHLGPYAVGPIVKSMADPKAKTSSNLLVYVLTRLGPAAIPPVTAMLQSPSDSQQALAADVLGAIGDKNDELPLMVAAYSPSSPPSVQNVARTSLAKILYGDPLKANRLTGDGLAERLVRQAVDLLTGKVTLPANDEGKVSIWTWSSKEGAPEESLVSAKSAALFRAEHLTRQALELRPENRPVQTELLAILLLRDVQTAGWDKPLPEGPGTAHDLLLTGGPELSVDVLDSAMKQHNVAAAAGALRVLAQTGSTALLNPGPRGKSVVLSALDYPDPRVQFAAATAILNWDPTHKFSGAGRIVEILARELNSDKTPNMVVVDPNTARGDELRSLMAALGYDAVRVRTGSEGFTAAAAQGDMAIAVLHLNTIRPELTPTVANFRADSRTTSVPIVIYGPANMRSAADRIISDYSNVSYLQEASTPAELNSQIAPLLSELTPPPLTDEQREERVKAAAYWLRHIAEGQRTHLYDLGPAEEALSVSIDKPEIGADVLVALVAIAKPSVQKTLATAATNGSLSPELRAMAARSLAYHIQKYGLTISNDELSALYDVYKNEADPAVKSAMAGIVGSTNPQPKTVSELIRTFPASEKPLP
jgi:hypothetical protein